MDTKSKVEYILLKYPATKFSRYEFLLYFLSEFHQAEYRELNYIIPAIQLRQFFAELETINRTLRQFLRKDERFKIPPEIDIKRKRKAKEFAMEFK